MLFTHIGTIVQAHPDTPEKVKGQKLLEIPQLKNAWLRVIDSKIESMGSMDNLPAWEGEEVVDLQGALLMPTWVDCHTHLVFAGSREEEFQWRLQGKGYEQIAAEGGGILNSAKKLQAASEDELYELAVKRMAMLVGFGTGTFEMKSGYGLTTEAELKILRVIRRLKNNFPEIPIKATFMGAHAVPKETNKADYMRLVCEEMIPQIAAEGLADYCDVFCDRGFFTPSEATQVLMAGKAHGMQPRIHANELGHTGGVDVAIDTKALSADHLEHLNDDEIENLRLSNVMPVFLPGTSFFLGIPYGPAWQLIERDMAFALASDFNPGSCPSGNMNLLASIACTQMKLPVEVVVNATTVNAAYALGLENEIGAIAPGFRANFKTLEPGQTLAAIPYNFGTFMPAKVFVGGKLQQEVFEKVK
jgi:imidazolonepropionase